MRIKKSHLEALHFFFGTLLTCFLVISASSNLRAETLRQMLGSRLEAELAAGPESRAGHSDACAKVVDAAQIADLPLDAQISSALVPYEPPMTEVLNELESESCAASKAAEHAVDPASSTDDHESLEALLSGIETALNPPAPPTCQDTGVFPLLASAQ